MQGQHGEFLIVQAMAGHLAASAIEDELVGTGPVLDSVQAGVHFAPERFRLSIPTEKDGFERPTQLDEGLVGRVGEAEGSIRLKGFERLGV
jgi:hypothetical protein